MPKCTIDGKEIEFTPGENLVEVVKRAGTEVPVFCYHPGLSVVAQCRMCAVEIEKMPKIQTACSTQATDGMVVHTQSEKVIQARESVMEFLLINHPLDCPVCDKSGECDLQDHSYDHGSPNMRTTEDRRTYLDLDMGPVIQKNMNRCIHCTRCIRFGDEIAGSREMVALQRGNDTEITTIDGRALETDYAGNYADICPTGSLTLKDFRFNKRVWFLKKTPTVCEGCSRGCNMEVHQDANIVYRCLPRENQDINKWWLCDEGRFNFNYVHNQERVVEPQLAFGSELKQASWDDVIQKMKSGLKGKKAVILVGTDLTQEELSFIQKFSKEKLDSVPLFHFGTKGVSTVDQDANEDRILKRKSKTANLFGAEKLGIPPFESLPSGTQVALVFRGGRAQMPELGSIEKYAFGVFMKSDVLGYSAVLPGAAFTEKEGTVFNFEGREQKYKRAIMPPRDAKYVSEFLMIWSNAKNNEAVI